MMPDSPFILFIRHAEREPIVSNDQGHKALLTPRGEKAALEFGSYFRKYSGLTVYTSPIERCIQTGRKILEGAGFPDEKPVKENYLASAYIDDPDIFLPLMISEGFEKILMQYLAEGIYPGLRPLEEGSLRLLKFLTERISSIPSVFISHDAVVMPFLNYFTGEFFSIKKWLTYLHGAFIPQENNTLLRKGIARFRARFPVGS